MPIFSGNVDYRDFLKTYAANQQMRDSPAVSNGRQSAVFDRRPVSQMSNGVSAMLKLISSHLLTSNKVWGTQELFPLVSMSRWRGSS